MPSGTVPWIMNYNIAFWDVSMEYGLQYYLLGRFDAVWFAMLPSGTVPWIWFEVLSSGTVPVSMVYNITFWDGSMEYGLQYCFLGQFHGVWLPSGTVPWNMV